MGFQKGRKKTGGRVKGGPQPAPTKLIDQMKRYGFNYARELALALKAAHADDPLKRFNLLQDLLPYMVPKLREKEIDTTEDRNDAPKGQSKISDADLLKALESDEPRETQPTGPAPLEQGTPDVQVPVPANPAADLRDVGQEQGEE